MITGNSVGIKAQVVANHPRGLRETKPMSYGEELTLREIVGVDAEHLKHEIDGYWDRLQKEEGLY